MWTRLAQTDPDNEKSSCVSPSFPWHENERQPRWGGLIGRVSAQPRFWTSSLTSQLDIGSKAVNTFRGTWIRLLLFFLRAPHWSACLGSIKSGATLTCPLNSLAQAVPTVRGGSGHTLWPPGPWAETRSLNLSCWTSPLPRGFLDLLKLPSLEPKSKSARGRREPRHWGQQKECTSCTLSGSTERVMGSSLGWGRWQVHMMRLYQGNRKPNLDPQIHSPRQRSKRQMSER